MQILANKIRVNEVKIGLILKGASLLFKIKMRTKKVIIPDIEVAKAMPANFMGNINQELRIIFKIRPKKDTFAGVTVSFKAKKADCNIRVAP